MRPLVSILIPCYNAERWIKEAIESALAQTWSAKEVIVVDDGSNDGSVDIIRSFGDRVRSEVGMHCGANAARNRLLELAQGKWVQYLDADDYLLPEKIERQIRCALAQPDCEVLYSKVAWERIENGRLICTDTEIPEPRDPWILLPLWLLPQTGGMLYRRSALRRVGGWRVGQPCCQEHELYFRLLEAGCQFSFAEGCLAVYRDLDYEERITRRLRTEIDRQRIAIFDRIEKCLCERGELSLPRRQAVNDARHQIARKLWRQNRQLARSVVRRIHVSDPHFHPGAGPASPTLYRLAYVTLGFAGAQRLAVCRQLLSSISARSPSGVYSSLGNGP